MIKNAVTPQEFAHLFPAKLRKTPVYEESNHAKQLTKYLDFMVQYKKILCYTKVPHETYTTSMRQLGKNKAEGVRPGIPDYVIVTPNEVVFLELKKPKGGVVSKDQAVWLEAVQGKPCRSVLAKGAGEAITFLEGLSDN